MSNKRKTSKLNGQSFNNEILKYCQNYQKYDKRARNDAKTRINDHLRERRGGIINCIHTSIKEFKSLDIPIKKDAPEFIDDDEIINNAAEQTTIQINKWDGVQIGQCKKEDSKGHKILIDTFEKFAKKAKNHQDQTSWKISGDYFFAPYIAKARVFLTEYCQFIDISEDIRIEIESLLCLSFANALFHEEIKFHRTKPKPLMRHRTLVKSTGIHKELEELHTLLTVRTFKYKAKEKRKKLCGKSNIIAGDFFLQLKAYVHVQYRRQKERVYKLLGKSMDSVQSDSDFDESKNSDINDTDHSVGSDDIDMISNSSSNSTASIGYVCDKKYKKGKQRVSTFQCTNSERNRKKYDDEKQEKYLNNKKVNRQNKINKKATVVRKYCNNTHEFDMPPQIGDVNDINALNSDFCSDCNNDNSTVSTGISSIMTSNVSPNTPMYPYSYTEYNGNSNGIQNALTSAENKAETIKKMQNENYELQKQIKALRFELAQKRAHNHNPMPPPMYTRQYIRQPIVSYQMPPQIPPQMQRMQQMQRQMQQMQQRMQQIQQMQQMQQSMKQMQQPMNMGMEMDNSNDNNNERELFPGGPMINDDTLSYKPAFNMNQSTNIFPNVSVDPLFSSFPTTTNESPDIFDVNSSF